MTCDINELFFNFLFVFERLMFYNLIHVFVLIIYYNFKFKYGWYKIYNLNKTYVNIFKILMCENLKTSTERERVSSNTL